MSTRIKFCGATSWDDVELAVAAGADAVGMIFAESPRRIEMKSARYIAERMGSAIVPVGVFVDPTRDDVLAVRELFPNMLVQLSGFESPEFAASLEGPLLKAIHVGDEATQELIARCERYPFAIPLFDTKTTAMRGGTGTTFDWIRIAPLARSAFVAGGLTPDNVGALVRTLRPYGVDVRSGIETNGRKDAEKMKQFVRHVRENDAA